MAEQRRQRNNRRGGPKPTREVKAEAAPEQLADELTAVLEEVVSEPEKPKKGETVTPLSDTDFMIGNRQYKLVADHRDGFDAEKLGERYSEVLARYDYIVGDWGYEQLRLKGFFAADDRKAQAEQRIDTLEDYLYEFCNFGCAYFVIQRVGGKKEKPSGNRRRKKTTNNNRSGNGNNAAAEKQPAHIAEKKEDINQRKNRKPVLKKDKPSQVRPQAQEQKPKSGKKGGFTIRKREE